VADEASATCTTVNELVLDTTEKKVYACTVAGSPGTWVNIAGTVSSPDFEGVYTTDAGKNLDISAGATNFSIVTGTNDFIVDSNAWNVTMSGDLDAASITSNGALTATGTTNLNGTANLNGITNIGDGGDNVAVNSGSWIFLRRRRHRLYRPHFHRQHHLHGRLHLPYSSGRQRPGTCSVGQQYFNTTANTLHVCTASNVWTAQGTTATAVNGGVLYGNTSSGTYGFSAAGTAGQFLQSNGAAAPTWADAGGGMMLTGNTNNTLVNNSTLYFPIAGNLAGAVDSVAGSRTLFSRSGTIKNFYLKMDVILTAGKVATVTVMKTASRPGLSSLPLQEARPKIIAILLTRLQSLLTMKLV